MVNCEQEEWDRPPSLPGGDVRSGVRLRLWRLSRDRDHRQRLCSDEIAEHLVIPSEAEEWSGLVRCDRDGQAVGRVSEKRSSQSLAVSTSVRIFRSDSRVGLLGRFNGRDNARVFGNVTPAGVHCNDIGRATGSSPKNR